MPSIRRAPSDPKASTERWQKDEPIGLLDGVPVTVDNIATKGVAAPLGAASMPLVPAEGSPPPRGCVNRHGHFSTTMPERTSMLSSGLLQLPSPHPRSLGSHQKSSGYQFRRRCRGGAGYALHLGTISAAPSACPPVGAASSP